MKLLSAFKRAAPHPDRFTEGEREAMVELLAVYVQSPNNQIAMRAVEAVVAMLGFNADAERCSSSRA